MGKIMKTNIVFILKYDLAKNIFIFKIYFTAIKILDTFFIASEASYVKFQIYLSFRAKK